MEELKPCQFCGGEAKTSVDYDQAGGNTLVISAYVRCMKCGVSKRRSMNILNKTFEEVVKLFAQTEFMWNSRV